MLALSFPTGQNRWAVYGGGTAFVGLGLAWRPTGAAAKLTSMCGRAYETYSDEELYFRYLSKLPLTPLALSPTYNLCPTHSSPVLRWLPENGNSTRCAGN